MADIGGLAENQALFYANVMEPTFQTEHVQVLEVMKRWPMLSEQMIAVRLGWIHDNGRPQAWRVRRALTELAASKRVALVGKKWCLIKEI